MGETVAAATEEGTQVMVLIEIWLKRYKVKHSESVGADTSRPPCTGIERFVYTAHVRYLSGGWYPPLRVGWLPFNALLPEWGRCVRGGSLSYITKKEIL